MFACAESCTGGLLSSQITALPGASQIFWGSIVVYSCQAKKAILGLSEDLLREYGVVSGPCALALAEGLARISQVPLNLSITGVMGPNSLYDVPAGTVWFGLAGSFTSRAIQFKFEGSRTSARLQAARLGKKLLARWCLTQGNLDNQLNLTYDQKKSFVSNFPN